MKKQLVITALLSIFFCASVQAQSVSSSEAQARAEQFMQQRGMVKKLTLTSADGKRARLKSGSVAAAYYVFNAADNGGFVIVAADERAQTILGYSREGNLDEAKAPAHVRAFLADYANQIEALRTLPEVKPASNKARLAAVTETGKSTIAPLISSKWDQEYPPYNNDSPIVGGSRTPPGCVAVAMAQIMNYHKWPSNTTDVIPARPAYSLPAVPAGTAIDWANMLDVYGSSYTSQQASAVSKLLLYCGQSLNSTQYAAGGTGAMSTEVPDALVRVFNYDDDARYVHRNSYNSAQWENLIYNELKEGRPVFLAGATADPNGSAAHAFVCDGFDGDGFYHINWGWGGSNGYYSLEVLNPDLEKGEEEYVNRKPYSSDRQAVVGIHRPDGITHNPETLVTLITNNIKISGTKLQPEMHTGNYNDTYSVDYGFGIMDNDGNIGNVLSKRDTDFFFGFAEGQTYWRGVDQQFDVATMLSAPGTYKLVPVSKHTSATTWNRNLPGNIFVEAVVDASRNISLSVKNEDVRLTLVSIEAIGNLFAGSNQAVKVTLRNDGTAEYYGRLYFKARGAWDEEVDYVDVSVKVGSTEVFYFTCNPFDEGNLQLSVSADNFATTLGSRTVTVKSATSGAANLSFSTNLSSTVYGKSTTFNLTVRNNGSRYANAVQLRLKTGGSYTDFYYENYIDLAAGATTVLPVTLTDLNIGSSYTLEAIYFSNWYDQVREPATFTVRPGIEVFDGAGNKTIVASSPTFAAPSNATAVSLEGCGTVSVTPSANPNCLYFLSATDHVTGLSGKNVVIDGVAGEVALTDGFDFFCPSSFTASRVTYTRTPLIGLNTGDTQAWETIVLPFAATSVTSEGKALDWFRSRDENGKNFWLKEFIGIDESKNIYFDFAGDVIAANCPYIICVPGNKWGAAWNLVGKELTFAGENVLVGETASMQVVTSAYKYVGTSQQKTATAYMMNAAGNAFEAATDAQVAAFRAFFINSETGGLAAGVRRLTIVSEDGGVTTGLDLNPTAPSSEAGSEGCFDLQGRRVNKPERGIYIVNGKKVMR